MKLFECVGGNTFKAREFIREELNQSNPFSGLVTEPGTVNVDIKSLPVALDDLLSPNTEYLAGNDPEGLAYIQDLKRTSKIVGARRVPGYDSNFRKSSNPNDFMYEIVTSYRNEKGETWGMLFGVSADGKNIQLFQS